MLAHLGQMWLSSPRCIPALLAIVSALYPCLVVLCCLRVVLRFYWRPFVCCCVAPVGSVLFVPTDVGLIMLPAASKTLWLLFVLTA